MSWREFMEGAPELASIGLKLLNRQIAYLATLKTDGAPRLHPVRPFIGEGHLFIFIDRESPKRRDLLRDGRFALHCSVFQNNGPGTEFLVTGTANLIDDPATRKIACRAVGRDLPDQYALFVFSVERVIVTEYDEERVPTRFHWIHPQ